MPMKSFKRSISCSKDKLFGILSDIPNWNKWDPDLAETQVTTPGPDGAVQGTKGKLKMKFKGNPEFDFDLHTADPDGYVAYKTTHFGGTMDWFWDFRGVDKDGVLVLEEGVKFQGGLGWLYGFAIGGECEKAFEQATLNLKNMCEESAAEVKSN
jgi:hypothetical protein